MKLGRRPPFWMFEAGVHKPCHTLRNHIFYAHTKFGKDILIGAGDMPQKRTSKRTPPGGGILLPVLTLMPYFLWGLSYVPSCKMSAKSDNRRPSYSYLTILPFGAHFGVPFAPTDLRVGGTHSNPVGTLRYAHHRSLTLFFRFPKKSSSSKWRRSEQEWYRNLGHNLALFDPTV